jgi:hypothetical protein
LLVHAARKWDTKLWTLSQTAPFHETLRRLGFTNDVADDRGLPFGALVGVVMLVDCVPTETVAFKGKPGSDPGFFEGWIDGVLARHLVINPTERAFGDYAPARYAWLCAEPVSFAEPVPCTGRQQLFQVADGLVRDRLGQLAPYRDHLAPA